MTGHKYLIDQVQSLPARENSYFTKIKQFPPGFPHNFRILCEQEGCSINSGWCKRETKTSSVELESRARVDCVRLEQRAEEESDIWRFRLCGREDFVEIQESI